MGRAGGQRLGDEVFQLAGLVATEGQPGIAVLAFGPDPGATEMVAQTIQRMDGTITEEEWIAGEISDGHEPTILDRSGVLDAQPGPD
jgi:hypothetical protein